MSLSGEAKTAKFASELTQQLVTHSNIHGGVAALLVAPPGAGKTTFLLRIAKEVGYIDTDGKRRWETVIWRGREFDYFSVINKKALVIHMHKPDYDAGFKVSYENGKPYDMTGIEIRVYKSIPHLNQNIVKQKINWVYPPNTYHVSKELKKILNKGGMKDEDIGTEELTDNTLWWFELWYYLSKYKRMQFLSIFFDEAQQLMGRSAQGLKWHVNQYLFKYLFADARKRKISIFMACHGITELDGPIRVNKIGWKVYMKGARVEKDSEIWRSATRLELHKKGDYFIEGDIGWGKGHVHKMDIETLLVEFNKPEEKDEIYGGNTEEFNDEPGKAEMYKDVEEFNRIEEKVDTPIFDFTPDEPEFDESLFED